MISAVFCLPSNKIPVRQYTCETCSITETLNEAGRFDFAINSSELVKDVIDFQINYFVQIYNLGVKIVEGFLDNVSLNYDAGSISFSCNSGFEALTKIKAKADAVYQNAQLLSIVHDLLTLTTDWTLGDVSTMDDPEITTTLDLRAENQLFPQILQAVKSIPNTFCRYGGLNSAGLKTIDIGYFNEEIAEIDVNTLSRNIKSSDVLQTIESYGGLYENPSGTNQIISLQDALNFDATLASHADFPIITINGKLVVKNNSVDVDYSLLQIYSNITTQTKVTPSTTEKNQAGYALWLKTVSDLEQRSENIESWSATSLSLPDDFKIGDRVFIRGHAVQSFYDTLSGKIIRIQYGDVEEWFKVNSYTFRLGDKIEYDLSISLNDRLYEENPILALYDGATKNQPAKDTSVFSLNSNTLKQYKFTEYIIPYGVLPNITVSDLEVQNHPAYRFTINIPSFPGGTTNVVLGTEIITSSSSIILKINTLTQSQIDLTISFDYDWTPFNTATLFILWEYS